MNWSLNPDPDTTMNRPGSDGDFTHPRTIHRSGLRSWGWLNQQPRGEARQAVISEAALTVIAGVGPDGLTYRLVVAQAGLPAAVATCWFASNDLLFRSLRMVHDLQMMLGGGRVRKEVEQMGNRSSPWSIIERSSVAWRDERGRLPRNGCAGCLRDSASARYCPQCLEGAWCQLSVPVVNWNPRRTLQRPAKQRRGRT